MGLLIKIYLLIGIGTALAVMLRLKKSMKGFDKINTSKKMQVIAILALLSNIVTWLPQLIIVIISVLHPTKKAERFYSAYKNTIDYFESKAEDE